MARRKVDKGSGPDPSPAAVAGWTALLEAADELLELAPWAWMGDSQVFAVHDGEQNLVGYCSVLGALGPPCGLIVFDGDAGRESLAALLFDAEDELDGPYSKHGLRLVFVDREEVLPETRLILDALGRCQRDRGAWPEASSLRPGYVHQVLTEREAAFLAHVSREVLLVAKRVRDEPKLLEGDLLLRRGGKDVRVPRPEPGVRPPPPPVDEATLARVAGLPQTRATWLGDHYLSSAIIDEGPRPFYARQLVWADAESGMLLDIEMGRPESGARELRDCLVRKAVELGLPARVVVRRPEVEESLRSLDPQRLQVLRLAEAGPFREMRDRFEGFLLRGR